MIVAQAGRIFVVFMALTSVVQSPAESNYRIEASSSKIELSVFKEGFLSVFGHDHLIAAKSFSGTVRFSSDKIEASSVSLSIEAESLTVLDPGVSEKDRKEVQATMAGPQVLDVQAYPKIVFRSSRVTRIKRVGDSWEATLTGNLNLHGVEKEIAFPIRVRLEDDRLHVTGEVFLAQTQFGMTPVKAGGGTIRVQDRVKLTFNIVAIAP